MKNLNQKGITLIALIITIIVLLILAGIVISLTIGNRGIVNHAEQAGIKSEEASAREKLELALLDLQAEKATNPEYNENEYIDNYLSKQNMVLNGDIVLVDGWQFRIDRSVPKIAIALGKGQESKEINLTATVENEPDYTKSKIKIEVAYEGEITSIQINGEELTILEKVDGKYVLEKEILQNGNYTVYVKDVNDSYKIAKVKVTEISEDMVIRTPEDLVALRDRVNKGATYAGKTVTLENDIDLSSVCGADVNGVEVSWVPIGTDTISFAGTFNGNYHTISNLYINSSNISGGLFFIIDSEARIEKVRLDTSKIILNNANHNVVGIIARRNYGVVYQCEVGKNCEITATTINGTMFAGGIVGDNQNKIEECVNKSKITASSQSGNIYVGGIAGVNRFKNTIITNCYNTGELSSLNTNKVGCGGITAENQYCTISNCYNTGLIKSGRFKGAIAARNGYDNTSKGTLSYCYYLNNNAYSTYDGGTTALQIGIKDSNQLRNLELNTTLGSAFTNDVQNPNGTWKYNGGYPILKWQLEQ